MSGAAIARGLLTGSAPLTAQVPAARIIAGVLPQGTALPCIAITEISGTDRQTVAPGTTIKVTDRVQITVMAETYPAVKLLLGLVRKACRNKLGTVGGFTGTTCRLDGKGPDFQEPDAGFCMQSQDLLITFNESAG